METPATKKVDWTRALTDKLIEAYQNEVPLYAIDDALYHNRDNRVQAWVRIASELDVTGDI